MALLPREHVRVLCFNARHVLLHDAWVGLGTVDSCAVDPREVYLPALRVRAHGVVLVHNHPSGDPEPSVGDVAATRQLLTAGKALGIRLLDHLVIGAEGFVSLAARGLLPDDGRGALVTVQSALTKPSLR
jgi:DNA repair protein RadC